MNYGEILLDDLSFSLALLLFLDLYRWMVLCLIILLLNPFYFFIDEIFLSFYVAVMSNSDGFLSRLLSHPRISKLLLFQSKLKIQLPRIVIQM